VRNNNSPAGGRTACREHRGARSLTAVNARALESREGAGERICTHGGRARRAGPAMGGGLCAEHRVEREMGPDRAAAQCGLGVATG
jgi:hypothetical protein